MKKILILFLLAFPILIFAIINISASIIGWYIPLPVEKVEVSLDGKNWQKSIVLNILELKENEEEHDIFIRVLPANARNHKVISYSSDEMVSEIKDDGYNDIKDGVIQAKVTVYDYGYNEITIITDDGKYEATIDVSVVNPNDDPNLVKSLVLEYKERLHSNYQFGYSNLLNTKFKYFPKTADKEKVLEQINIDFNGEYSNLSIDGLGNGSLTLDFLKTTTNQELKLTTTEGRQSKFSFNVDSGYNIKGHSEEDIKIFTTSGSKVYQLEEIDLTKTLHINSGTYYHGNNFKITHKTLLEGTAVLVSGTNTVLNQVHLVGPLLDVDGQIIPSDKVVNLRMDGSVTSRKQSITNSTIENGRYNLVIEGKAVHDGTNYVPSEHVVRDVKFVGSLMSSINIDNKQEGALMINSTKVLVKNLEFRWAGVGILLQNSSFDKGQKGFSELHVETSDNPSLVNSLDGSNNWRNLDEASGLLQEHNVIGLLDELKKYEHAIYKEGKYNYVSAIIMIRGGATNLSKVLIDSKTVNDLIVEKRTPSTMEAMHPQVGGRFPFTVYLLKPEFYTGGINTNE